MMKTAILIITCIIGNALGGWVSAWIRSKVYKPELDEDTLNELATHFVEGHFPNAYHHFCNYLTDDVTMAWKAGYKKGRRIKL